MIRRLVDWFSPRPTRRSLAAPALRILRLERRRVLSADFSFGASGVMLSGFDGGGETLTISQLETEYRFTLGSGAWSPMAQPMEGVHTDGQTLMLDAAMVDQIVGGLTVVSDEASPLDVQFGQTDFSMLDGPVQLVGIRSLSQAEGTQLALGSNQLALAATSDVGITVSSLNVVGDLNLFAFGPMVDGPGTKITVTGDATFISRSFSPDADFDGSGLVDATDYGIWKTNFGATGASKTQGDANGDGFVNAADYTVWRDTLGQTSQPGGITLANHPADLISVGGRATFEAVDGADRFDISVGQGGRAYFGSLSVIGANVQVREASSTVIDLADTTSFTLDSAGTITDSPTAQILASQNATLRTTLPVLEADFDGNGVVDQADRDIYDTFTGMSGATQEQGDANGDGQVNAFDLCILDATLGEFSGRNYIELAVDGGNVISVGGAATFQAGDVGSLDTVYISDAGAANFESLGVRASYAMIFEDSSTRLNDVLAQTFYLTSAGNVDQTAGTTIRGADTPAAELAIVTPADVLLENANRISILAADVDGSLRLRSVVDLTVGAVVISAGTFGGGPAQLSATGTQLVGISADGDTLDGTRSFSREVKLTAGGDNDAEAESISIVADIEADRIGLVADGAISQAAGVIATNETLASDGLLLMAGGDVALGGANSVGRAAASVAGTLLLNSTRSLEIGSVTVAGMNLAGVGGGSSSVKLQTAGDLSLLAGVSATEVGLVATGAISQTAAGIVTTPELLVMAGGNAVLESLNPVALVAADVDGSFRLRSIQSLTVGTASVAGMTITGVSADANAGVAPNAFSQEVKLTAMAVGNPPADLILDAGVQANRIGLVADRDITQDGVITTNETLATDGLLLMAGGQVTLGGANSVGRVAANVSQGTQGDLLLNSNRSLVVGTVTVAGMTFDGVNSSGRSGFAKLQATGDLSLEASITGNRVGLVASGSISQTMSGVVSTSQLLVMAGGNAVLEALNPVALVAADVDGSFRLRSNQSLTVGTASIFDMTIAGVSADANANDAPVAFSQEVKLTAVAAGPGTANLTLAAGVQANRVALVADQNVSQTGVITTNETLPTDGLLVMAGGIANLTGLNSVGRLAGDVNAALSFRSVRSLEVGSVTVAGMNVVGVSADADASTSPNAFSQVVKLTAMAVGAPTANLTLTAGVQANRIGLIADQNITQTGVITTNETLTTDGLLVMAGGNVTLGGANSVGRAAGSVAGALLLNSTRSLEIGSVSVAGMSLAGIDGASDGDGSTSAKLQTSGDLSLARQVLATEVGLVASGSINQQPLGAVSTPELLVMAGGDAVLESPNFVAVVAADVDGSFRMRSIQNLTVGSATVQGMTIVGVSADANAGASPNSFSQEVKLSVLSVGPPTLSLTLAAGVQANRVGLVADTDITQTAAGVIATNEQLTTDGLLVMAGGNATLAGLNSVGRAAADVNGSFQLRSVRSLEVGSVTVAGMTVRGVSADADASAGASAFAQEAKLTAMAAGGPAASLTLAAGVQANRVGLIADQNITQSSLGLVTINETLGADGLLVMAGGNATLGGANSVGRAAASVGGNLLLNSTRSLEIGAVSVAGMTLAGVGGGADSAKIQSAADLTLAADVNATEVGLVATTNINQTAGIVTTPELLVMADGNAVLEGLNQVALVAADVNGSFRLRSVQDLTVGTASVQGMTITGVSADANANTALNMFSQEVKLTAMAVGVPAANLTFTAGVQANRIGLIADQDITQSATGLVTTNEALATDGLLIMAGGNATLTQTNSVGRVAADVTGDLALVTDRTLEIGTVTVAGMTLSGIDTDNLTLTSGGSIVDAPTVSTFASGNATLVASSFITLADNHPASSPLNSIVVVGHGSFTVGAGENIDIGVRSDGTPAAAKAQLGSLNFDAPSGQVRIALDGPIILGATGGGPLSSTASVGELTALEGAITDNPDAATEFTTSGELVAAAGSDIILGDSGATFRLGELDGPAPFVADTFLALAAQNVSLEADTSINLRTGPADPAFLGTFFLTAAGTVSQVGDAEVGNPLLNATPLTANRVAINSLNGAVLLTQVSLSDAAAGETTPNLSLSGGGAEAFNDTLATNFDNPLIPVAAIIDTPLESPYFPVQIVPDPQLTPVDPSGVTPLAGARVLTPSRFAAADTPQGDADRAAYQYTDAYTVIAVVTGDARVGVVHDATGVQGYRIGVEVRDNGNAYVQTTAASSEAEAGDLMFTSRGLDAVDVMAADRNSPVATLVGAGALTALAAGTLKIDTEDPANAVAMGVRTTRLQSSTGTVTSLATATQPGVNGDQKGPLMVVDSPTELQNAATTGLIVGTNGIASDRPFEQRVTLVAGSRFENNLFIELETPDVQDKQLGGMDLSPALAGTIPFADITGVSEIVENPGTQQLRENAAMSPLFPALAFSNIAGDARAVTAVHVYDQAFFPNNPDVNALPTTFRLYNDPNINLFEGIDDAVTDLNFVESSVTPRVVSAQTGGYYVFSAPETPTQFVATAPLPLAEPAATVQARVVSDQSRATVSASIETILYGRIENGDWADSLPGEEWPVQWDGEAEGDFLEQIREKIDEGPAPEGKYRIVTKTTRGEQPLDEWVKGAPSDAVEAMQQEKDEEAIGPPDGQPGGGPMQSPQIESGADAYDEAFDSFGGLPKGYSAVSSSALAAALALARWNTRLIGDDSAGEKDKSEGFSRAQRRRRARARLQWTAGQDELRPGQPR